VKLWFILIFLSAIFGVARFYIPEPWGNILVSEWVWICIYAVMWQKSKRDRVRINKYYNMTVKELILQKFKPSSRLGKK